jgi:hypothetical protein
VRGWGDYAWVRDPLWALELRCGPFWEPQRPPCVTSADDILTAAVATESLLEGLATGRRRSFLWASFISTAAGITVAVVASSLEPNVAAALVLGAMTALMGPVLWSSGWQRDWLLVGAVLMLPTRPAPNPVEIVASLRVLTDAFSGAPKEDAVRAYVQMSEITPLTFRASRRLTVVPSTIKKAV